MSSLVSAVVAPYLVALEGLKVHQIQALEIPY
jgi:hypothetical protein